MEYLNADAVKFTLKGMLAEVFDTKRSWGGRKGNAWGEGYKGGRRHKLYFRDGVSHDTRFPLLRSGKAVQDVADALGTGRIDAARAVVDLMNEYMAGARRMNAVQQGYDLRELALIFFGGAGSLHVVTVARLIGS